MAKAARKLAIIIIPNTNTRYLTETATLKNQSVMKIPEGISVNNLFKTFLKTKHKGLLLSISLAEAPVIEHFPAEEIALYNLYEQLFQQSIEGALADATCAAFDKAVDALGK